MYRLSFELVNSSYSTIMQMNEWLLENGCRSVTVDTLIKNLSAANPERYYRMRETDLGRAEFTITFSQENDRLLFKLRWSDLFKSSQND